MRAINIYIYVLSLRSTFLLYYVAYYPTTKNRTIFPKKLATLRGVAGPHPFFGKN